MKQCPISKEKENMSWGNWNSKPATIRTYVYMYIYIYIY